MQVLSVMKYASVGVIGLTLMGCVEHHHHDRPVYTQPAPPPQQYIIVPTAPPSPQVEVRPVRPSHSYVWVDGFWAWNGRQYVWQPGRWAVPPHGYSYWAPAHYKRHGHEYHYVPGHWNKYR